MPICHGSACWTILLHPLPSIQVHGESEVELLFLDNGIPIDGWVSEQNDTALLDFLPFLDALRFVEDVRSILSLRRLY